MTAPSRTVWALALVTACGTAVPRAASPTPSPAQGAQIVPLAAPDTVPQWVRADTNLVANRASFPYYANVILVSFRPGTPQADRQAAISAIGGRVVGGQRWPSGEGQYVVRIEAGRAIRPLMDAVRRLLAMPHVEAASVVIPAG